MPVIWKRESGAGGDGDGALIDSLRPEQRTGGVVLRPFLCDFGLG
jgi:hypothetical protein